MRSAKIGLAPFLIPAVLCLCATTRAAPSPVTTTYTDSSSFLSNVKSNYYLETFDGLTPGFTANNGPAGTPTDPLSFSKNGFSYDATAPQGLFVAVPSSDPNDYALSTVSSGDPLTITFTSGNITAVGGQFFPTTGAAGSAADGDVTVLLNDGTSITLTASAAGNPEPFAGFTSDTPITSLKLSEPFAQTFDDYPTINNLYVGQAIAPVPEPAFVQLGGMLVVGGLAFVKRRKRALA